jgi:hypothetical protein
MRRELILAHVALDKNPRNKRTSLEVTIDEVEDVEDVTPQVFSSIIALHGISMNIHHLIMFTLLATKFGVLGFDLFPIL